MKLLKIESKSRILSQYHYSHVNIIEIYLYYLKSITV